jgi:hypothetical protein
MIFQNLYWSDFWDWKMEQKYGERVNVKRKVGELKKKALTS